MSGDDRPAVLGLDHVGLSCANFDRAVAFFSGLLEVPVRDRGDLGGEAGTVTGHADLRGRFADLDLGAGRTLELFEIVEPQSEPVVPGALRPGGGHLALRVRGIDALVARLAEAGYAARSTPVELGEPGFWHGARVVYVDGPDGVVVELIERRSTP